MTAAISLGFQDRTDQKDQKDQNKDQNKELKHPEPSLAEIQAALGRLTLDPAYLYEGNKTPTEKEMDEAWNKAFPIQTQAVDVVCRGLSFFDKGELLLSQDQLHDLTQCYPDSRSPRTSKEILEKACSIRLQVIRFLATLFCCEVVTPIQTIQTADAYVKIYTDAMPKPSASSSD